MFYSPSLMLQLHVLLINYFSFQKRPYSFNYGVRDELSGTDFQQNEERSGPVTRGSYKVALPDGRIQIVTYVADDSGYKATVTYEGKASYPKPSEYSYDANFHGVPVLPHPPPLPHLNLPPRGPSPTLLPVAVPPHEAHLPKIRLNQFRLAAESVRDEVEVRGNAIPPPAYPPPSPIPAHHHVGPSVFTTPKPVVTATTPYYTTIKPYERPEGHRPPKRPPSPPTYRPVRHKRKNSKYNGARLGRDDKNGRERKKEKFVSTTRTGSKARGYLPKFANFEPSPDHSKPDGTKALDDEVKGRKGYGNKKERSNAEAKLFWSNSPTASRNKAAAATESPTSAAKLTNFVGPYAESAYIKPTTYRPSKEFIQKLKSKREAASEKNDAGEEA